MTDGSAAADRPAARAGASRAVRQAPRPHDPVRDDRGSADLCAVDRQLPAELAATTGSPPPTPRRWCWTRRRAAWCRTRLARQILDSIGARAVAMKMGNAAPAARRLRHAAGRSTTTSTCATCPGIAPSSTPSTRCSRSDNDVMRVVGPAPMGGDFLEIVLDEAPLRQAMLRFSINILLLSLVISGITATLVYLALHYLLVRPMRRITANMMAFRDDPENPARIIAASGRQRRDRHRRARACRHAARPRLDAAAEEPSRRARARGVEDQPRSAQPADLGAAVLRPAGAACPTRACSASRPS